MKYAHVFPQMKPCVEFILFFLFVSFFHSLLAVRGLFPVVRKQALSVGADTPGHTKDLASLRAACLTSTTTHTLTNFFDKSSYPSNTTKIGRYLFVLFAAQHRVQSVFLHLWTGLHSTDTDTAAGKLDQSQRSPELSQNKNTSGIERTSMFRLQD